MPTEGLDACTQVQLLECTVLLKCVWRKRCVQCRVFRILFLSCMCLVEPVAVGSDKLEGLTGGLMQREAEPC